MSISNFFQAVRNFFRSEAAKLAEASVEGILADFHAIVDKLEAHVVSHEAEVEKQAQAVLDAIEARAKSELEILTAKSAAEGIRKLLGK